jgi:hypothetical protein
MPKSRPIKPLSYYYSKSFITNTIKRHVVAAIRCFLNGENPIFALAAITAFGISKALDTILFSPDSQEAIDVISNAVNTFKHQHKKDPSIFGLIYILITAFVYRVTPSNKEENNKLTTENREAFSKVIKIFSELSKETSIDQSIQTNDIMPLLDILDQAFSRNILPSLDVNNHLEEEDELIPAPTFFRKNKKFDLTAALEKLNTNPDEALHKLFELLNELCDASKFNEAFFVIQKIVRADQFDLLAKNNLIVERFISKLLEQVTQSTNPDYVLFALQALTELLQPNQYKNTNQVANKFMRRVDIRQLNALIKTFKPTTAPIIVAFSNLLEILLQSDDTTTHDNILNRDITIRCIDIEAKIGEKLKVLKPFNLLTKFSLGLGILGGLSTGVALLLLFVFAATFFNPWILLFVSAPLMVLGLIGFVGLKFWNRITHVIDNNEREERKLRALLEDAESRLSLTSTRGPFIIKTNLENWLNTYGIKSRTHSTLIKVLSLYSRLIDEIDVGRDKKVFEQCFHTFEAVEQLSDVIGARKTIDILLNQSDKVFLGFLSSTSLKEIFNKQAESQPNFCNRSTLYQHIRNDIVNKALSDPQFSQQLFKTCDDLLLLLKNCDNFLGKDRDAAYDKITSEQQRPCFKACIKDAEDFNKFLHFLERGENQHLAEFHVDSNKKSVIKIAIWQTIQSDLAFGDRVLDAKQPEVQKFMQEFVSSPSASSTSSKAPLVLPSVYAQPAPSSSTVVPSTVVSSSTNLNNSQ